MTEKRTIGKLIEKEVRKQQLSMKVFTTNYSSIFYKQ